ncbi:hypothetical protein RRG08_052050 [Elysia crispata]|uniref:Uncharacterized protein n=1 Tax=Elysia crispata TaxID=231223 RepID=A0AAE1A409_9GAST|nr:hypothetical protein RRG08_052050 [Elysia crispata]
MRSQSDAPCRHLSPCTASSLGLGMASRLMAGYTEHPLCLHCCSGYLNKAESWQLSTRLLLIRVAISGPQDRVICPIFLVGQSYLTSPILLLLDHRTLSRQLVDKASFKSTLYGSGNLYFNRSCLQLYWNKSHRTVFSCGHRAKLCTQ